MIEFEIMKVEGFASIKDETFDWGTPGLNIIQAPNGYGKTKFINALVWCLYGKPLSGSVEPWEHNRPSSYRGTMVKLWINIDGVGMIITRYKDYQKFKNSLLLQIEDSEPEDGSKVEIQNKINSFLGYSYDLFKNTIIFGQKLKRIISETGPNKKKVFDDAFEVTYIGKAKAISENKLSEFSGELSQALQELEITQTIILGKSQEIKNQQEVIDNFEDKKKEKIKLRKGAIKIHKADIKKITDKEDIYENLKAVNHDLESLSKDALSYKEIILLEKTLAKNEATLGGENIAALNLQSSICIIKSDIKDMPSKCDSCGKPYTAIERKDAKAGLLKFLAQRKKEYQTKADSISIIEGQIQELQSSISSANKLVTSIDMLKQEINRLEAFRNTISDIQKIIEHEKRYIKETRDSTVDTNLGKLILELSGYQEKEKAQRKTIKKIQRDVDTYEWLIKDPLSNAGLKAFIFNMMLDDINDRLEYYTTFIGFQVAFLMDMQSAHKNLNTYVFRDEEPVPYDDLSGGQQQAVDIVTAFAIHDVVSDSKNCSLLVMDEVFESLDKDNIEIMAELIQDKAQKKCLYLVTHRAEFNPTNAHVIQVGYDNGISSLV